MYHILCTILFFQVNLIQFCLFVQKIVFSLCKIWDCLFCHSFVGSNFIKCLWNIENFIEWKKTIIFTDNIDFGDDNRWWWPNNNGHHHHHSVADVQFKRPNERPNDRFIHQSIGRSFVRFDQSSYAFQKKIIIIILFSIHFMCVWCVCDCIFKLKMI